MRTITVVIALLLGLLGWTQAEVCKTCIWVGTAKTTSDMGLVFVADLTATPQTALGPDGTEMAYSVRAVVRPSSEGATLNRRRVRPRVAEFVVMKDLFVDFARSSYVGSMLVYFPVVGADSNVILKPTAAESFHLFNSSASTSNALQQGGRMISGKSGKTAWNFTLMPALAKSTPGGPTSSGTAPCPTCAWTGRFTTTSRQGTPATAAVTLTPVEVRGPVIRYKASAMISPSKVPQIEAGRADCKSEFLSPFTLDDAQFVEINYAKQTYRGVLTAQAEGLTRCSTKTSAFTDEVVLIMTVSPGGVDRPWAGGTSLGDKFTLAAQKGVTTNFTLTQLGEGQAAPTFAAPSTASTAAQNANCGKCIWVGTSTGTLQTLGMPFKAQVTLTPSGVMNDDGLMPYRAAVRLSISGKSHFPGCTVTLPGGSFTKDLEGLGGINYRKRTFSMNLMFGLALNAKCTGATAMIGDLLSQSDLPVYLTEFGAGDGLSLSENGTRFRGGDQNLKWDFKLQR